MKTRLLLPFLFVLAAFVASGNAQEDAFAKGNQEYAAGRFREAIELYENAVGGGATNAAVFYNLGNAYYRAGDLGRAILNYERALALESHYPEAEANLRLVRDKARALELKRSALDRIVLQTSATTYSVIAAIAFWIAAFCLATMFFSGRPSPLRATMLVTSVLVCAAGVAGVYLSETGSAGRALAIVTAAGTEARVATADSASTVLALPPGSQVKVLSRRGDWLYATLPNDLRGWIPAQNAERVRL